MVEFVDRFANVIDGMNGDEDFWDRMHAAFSDVEIGDIVLMGGVWLGTGHALKALGIGSVCSLPITEDTYKRLRNAELDVYAACRPDARLGGKGLGVSGRHRWSQNLY